LDNVGYCWGGNWHGQLGVGDRDGDAVAPCCYRVPKPIRTDLRFLTVAAGGIDSCGITLDGKAHCWGSPQEGRLGTGAADAANKSADKTVPTAVAGDLLFATVMPRWHTCGLSLDGAAFCWGGAGVHGVLGAGNSIQADFVPVPVRVAGSPDWATIVVSPFHNCALTRDGIASCWGENTDGELGDGTTQDAAVPRRVATTRRFIAIAAGGNALVARAGDVSTWGFTCGVTTDDGGVLCWGDNRHGALGNGSTNRALTPVPISDPTGSIH
jgi:alpha-tubulin suppressor-like RCC1 family protein